MPAIFIYYITDYMFFLYVLSNEKAKIWARQQIRLMLSTARMTTKHSKTYHWSRENEVMKRIPGGSWAIYTCSWHQTAGDTIMYVWQRYLFFWKSNKDPPKPLDSKKMWNICSWADLLAGYVRFFSLLPSVTTWQILHSAFVYCWSSNKRSW